MSETYDIKKLLSTEERDFLIRNNGDQVKIDSLIGKFVGLYFMRLPKDCECEPLPWGLVKAYNNLRPKGVFEVVFVALTENDGDSDELFNKCFSKMPWLGIPFSDFGTRNHLGTAFPRSSSYGPECLLLDTSGTVLDDYALPEFNIHEADWYPFNYSRLEEIEEEEKAARQEMSLKNLLASPSRDYVLTNQRQKVPIGDLEKKVVGLYFYDGRDGIMHMLRFVYDNLKDKGMDFEIVFINIYFNGGYRDEESFEKNLEEMPWLALPFADTKCGKLWNMFDCPGFDYNDVGVLVIIKSGEFYEPYGMRIFQDYGIEAYPFTRRRAAELEIERRSLLPLFDAAGQKFVIKRGGTRIQVSDLRGKNIILLLASSMRVEHLSRLIRWYEAIKRKDKEFDLIYVSGCKTETIFNESFGLMPWLALPFRTGDKILRLLNWDGNSMLVAFGPDGKLLTKNVMKFLLDDDHWEKAYPFSYDDNLLKEAIVEIETELYWFPIEDE